MEIYEFKPIYCYDKKNKIKIWYAKIFQEENTNQIYVILYHGYMDGKIQENKTVYSKGKNIGKKNETTVYEQCLQETKKKWLDKQEKENYQLSIETLSQSKIIYPMLAQSFDLNHSKIVYPCFVQPKLDGCRCIVYQQKDKIMFQSRTGSYFTSLLHLENELKKWFEKYPDKILDGELYTSELPFEVRTGLIKKKKINETDTEWIQKIKYHIYDIVNENMYIDRYNEILKIMNPLPPFLSIVETILIQNVTEIKTYHQHFTSNGYEGIIIRNTNAPYQKQFRSPNLLKYKTFQENEYEIVDFKEGIGREVGCVLWICKTNQGQEFSVRPKGSLEYRKQLYQQGDTYIGKKLTVIYQELSEYGVPRFPVGKDIRIEY
jgi:DNA ligase-1